MPKAAQPKQEGGKQTTVDDYLGDVELPPSSDEEEEPEEGGEEGDASAQRQAANRGQEERAKEKRTGSLQSVSTQQRKKQERRKEKKEHILAQTQVIEKEKALNESPEDAYSVRFSRQPDWSALANMKDVKVEGFSVSARGKDLLVNTNLTIVHGRRYGLVGPNGKGKTTLMKLLATQQLPVPDSMDVLLVEQEVHADDRSALQAVIESDQDLMSLRDEERDLKAKLDKLSLHGDEGASPKDDEYANSLSSRLDEVYDKLQQRGSFQAEATASKILHGLGFSKEMQNRTTNTFSGGWRMRISLARALFLQPSLLLLDEPTNHLDLRAVLWLEEYLQRWKKTIVVVSHDRDFLNMVATDIIHLHDQKLDFYRGNFAQFEEMYEQRKREANKAYEKYEKQMREAKKSGTKEKQRKVDERMKAEQKQKRKKGSKGATDEEQEEPEAPRKWHDYNVKFEFPEPTELPPPLIQMQDVYFKYPSREDFQMNDLNLGIDMGSRIAIVGANGSGKTTLMNLIAGDLEPTDGFCRRSPKLRIGRYSQHFIDQLNFEENPVEYLQNKFSDLNLKHEHIRKRLGKFGLPGNNHLTPIMKLSGGQKARLIFTSIALSQPHIMLLDEPTNHLVRPSKTSIETMENEFGSDMQSIDALADALDAFEGGVVVISHDSRLLQTLCSDEERSEVWEVDGGTVRRFEGDFEDYKERLIDEIRKEMDDE